MRQHGPWTVLNSQSVYRDPWMEFIRDEVIRPDGEPGSYCYVKILQGISVLAVDDQKVACLTREFHYAVGRDTLEVVSGGINAGETPESAALRELKEELGISAIELQDLGIVDPFTSMLHSPTRLFLAQGLTFGEHHQEGTENVQMVRIPFEEAVAAVFDGRITHAPSCVAILKARDLLQPRT